jgi:hypothetical protein
MVRTGDVDVKSFSKYLQVLHIKCTPTLQGGGGDGIDDDNGKQYGTDIDHDKYDKTRQRRILTMGDYEECHSDAGRRNYCDCVIQKKKRIWQVVKLMAAQCRCALTVKRLTATLRVSVAGRRQSMGIFMLNCDDKIKIEICYFINVTKMGGEQYSVLMYGPAVNYTIEAWIEKFKLLDKKEWVKNFLLNGEHDYEEPYDSDDERGIDIVFEQEFDKNSYFDLLSAFLEKHSMQFVFDNNFHWDAPYIGMEIKDYNLFSESDKKTVKDFCEEYDLPDPTFYAGIIGELE